MKKIIFLILLTLSLGLHAQQEAANWYFGENAGIRFDAAAGTVAAVTDGQLNTREGCSSISDADGNLLFYSDGTSVWNRNHVIMQNGTGLLGNSSSTQSAIIVAKPQDPNTYYIFTVDTEVQGDPPSEGLNYSEVDMTLDGGNGAVTLKNINLMPKSSEKVSAVLKDCVTKSLWVISFGNQNSSVNGSFDTYYAYEITASGVNTTAVTSTFPISIQDRRGYLKFSPDGTKMATANMHGTTPNGANPVTNSLLLYDFDVATGIVSNQQDLIINDTGNQAYGIEFSPSNELLYVHASNGGSGSNPTNHFSSLTQFDLTAPDIQASEILLDSRNLYRGALQLGPDGRIYRTQSTSYLIGQPFLAVINNPDALGLASNYQHNAIPLGNNATQGLPPFDQSLFNAKIDIIRNGLSITNLNLCTGDDYTLIADDIPGASYTWTLDGAPLAETDFDLVINQGGLYEVEINPNNGDCIVEGEATVSYYTIPTVNTPNRIDICDDDNNGIWEFDFTTQDNQVLNGQSNITYEVKYFESQTDADADINEITGLYTNTSNPQEIFTRIHNIGNTNCYETTSFFIEVFDSPTANPLSTIEGCDNLLDGDDSNGQSDIDLAALIPTVLGTQSATDYAVTFHASQPDADANNGAFPATYYNSTSPFSQVIFVRIENNANTNCFATTSFEYIVNPVPASFNQTLIQCDEDGNMDGLTAFNLTEADADITGGATNVSTSFFLSLIDAQNDTGAIDGANFNNTVNPQMVYVKVTDNITTCSSIATLTLDVSVTNINDVELTQCDDDGTEDGLYEFTLSDADTDVLTGTPAGITLFYYETYDDALLEQNPIGPTYTNTVPYSQTIFARAENANACYGISEVLLTVYELPDIEITDEAIYCLNTFPDTITLDAGLNAGTPTDYTYVWSTGEMTHGIQINAPGTYTVTVTNANNCTKDRTITVLPSNTATFTGIQITDASSNNTITVLVTGEGDYEFALDDPDGFYQDSNFFENVPPGLHTVYVRDKNDCGIVEELVSVIGFPKYLTPNNDGFHDTWQVDGLASQFQPNTKIFIYDRYGKLLKQLDPLGLGWDGRLNGKLLPTSDYWFAVTLQDGRVFKSHFTLKR